MCGGWRCGVRRLRIRMTVVATAGVLSASPAGPAGAQDWSRFRGPDGAGVDETSGLPVEFSPAKNVLWKTDLPVGFSSPVIAGDRIFLTGVRNDTLLTMAVSRTAGRLLWER